MDWGYKSNDIELKVRYLIQKETAKYGDLFNEIIN